MFLRDPHRKNPRGILALLALILTISLSRKYPMASKPCRCLRGPIPRGLCLVLFHVTEIIAAATS